MMRRAIPPHPPPPPAPFLLFSPTSPALSRAAGARPPAQHASAARKSSGRTLAQPLGTVHTSPMGCCCHSPRARAPAPFAPLRLRPPLPTARCTRDCRGLRTKPVRRCQRVAIYLPPLEATDAGGPARQRPTKRDTHPPPA